MVNSSRLFQGVTDSIWVVRAAEVVRAAGELYAVPDGSLPDFKAVDLKAVTPRSAVFGEFATYTGFTAPGESTFYTRIDFAFGGSNGKW